MRRPGRAAGFTLVELLIAVAVIGILASIAYPTYTEYVKSARVTDGKSLLMEVASRLERCYTASSTYSSCIDAGEFPLESDDSSAAFYEISSGNYTASGASYTVRATADADQVKCSWLEVKHTGERTSDNGCW